MAGFRLGFLGGGSRLGQTAGTRLGGLRAVASYSVGLSDTASAADAAGRTTSRSRALSDTAAATDVAAAPHTPSVSFTDYAGAAASPWTPLQLSPTAWWDMSALGLASGAAVSSVPDLSGNGFTLTQSVAGQRPTYTPTGLAGLGAVNFDASVGQMLSASGVRAGSPFTIIVVLQGASGSNGFVYEQSANINNLIGAALINNVGATVGVKGSTVTSPGDDKFSAKDVGSVAGWMGTAARMLTHACDGTHAGHLLYNNGSVIGTLHDFSGSSYNNDPGTATSSTSFNVGARVGMVLPFTGKIAEIIYVARALSAYERALVHSYLTDKYVAFTASDYAALPRDVVMSAFRAVRPVGDTATASDAGARSLALTRTAADAVTMADAVTRSQMLVRALGDSVTAGDTGTRLLVVSRAVADTIVAADVATGPVMLFRSALDTVLAADALSRSQVLARSVSDATTVSDGADRAQVLLRSVQDALDASDAVLRSQVLSRTVADAVSGTDMPLSTVSLFRAVLDTAPVSDEMSRTYQAVRLVAESVVTVDDVARTLVALRFATDLAPAIDDASRTSTLSRAASDIAAALDVMDRSIVVLRTVADAGQAADVPTRSQVLTRLVIDTLAIADAPSRQLHRFRGAADLLTIGDVVSRALMLPRAVTDAGQAADVVTRSGIFVRAVFDAATVADAAVNAIVYFVPFGPPISRILSVTGSKVSHQDGYSQVVVEFVFDQPVTAWVVRAGSASVYDGAVVTSWSGPVRRQVEVATVSDVSLLIGANDLAVYGRSADGQWTF